MSEEKPIKNFIVHAELTCKVQQLGVSSYSR